MLFRNLRVPFADGLAIWRPIFRHPRPAVQGQAVDATAAIGCATFTIDPLDRYRDEASACGSTPKGRGRAVDCFGQP